MTTTDVLSEFLTFFAGFGPGFRTGAAAFVEELLVDPNVDVVPPGQELFLAGVSLYRERSDKEYSLADCVSMVTMHQRGISEIFTHDHHFTQEGSTALMRSPSHP